MAIVDTAFANPVQPSSSAAAAGVPEEVRDASRVACNASVVHQADRMLRDLVGKKMREFAADSSSVEAAAKKSRSQELNGARTELLEDLKTGFQKLPAEVVGGVKSRDSEAVSRLRELVTDLFDLKLNNCQ